MNFTPPLVPGRLIKRYKRFLADVRLDDGALLTAHCPNTGSMKNCAQSGSRVWLQASSNPARKYPFTWELVETEPGELACIHSARANSLVVEALEQGCIPELSGYDSLHKEVRYGQEKSRIDLLLQCGEKRCYVEIKSVTLHVGTGLGLFPDAVSARGTRHLRELQRICEGGQRAVLFFCVQHSAIRRVAPAHAIDPEYADTLRAVMATGVEVLAYGVSISASALRINRRLDFCSTLTGEEG